MVQDGKPKVVTPANVVKTSKLRTKRGKMKKESFRLPKEAERR